MSLPWRFLTVDDYVDGTVENLRQHPEKFTQLNVGKHYLHGSELETRHIITLFQGAAKNANIEDISFSGIKIESEAIPAMVGMLSAKNKKNKGKKVTFNTCSGVGVQGLFPAIPLESIRISNSEMSNESFEVLGMHIEQSNMLMQLKLFELNLSGPQVRFLARGLGTTQSLTLLEISYCILDDEAINELSIGLSRNTSLDSFYVPGCELEDAQLDTILSSFSNHPKLRHLKVFRNHCGTMGASKISEILEINTQNSSGNKAPALESLDLSYQQFERANKLDCVNISKSLSQNTILTVLKLSFNKLNDADAETISLGLRDNRVLQELDLRANNIRDEGIIALAKNIVFHNSSLIRLFLFGNPFSEKGAQHLLQAIQENLTMEVLNMDYCVRPYNDIQFYTCLNRAGRRLLRSDRFNLALWPIVLEQAEKVSRGSHGVCSHADLVYQLIRGPALCI